MHYTLFHRPAWWPNGKALLSGGKDCGFESRLGRIILGSRLYFTLCPGDEVDGVVPLSEAGDSFATWALRTG